MDDEIIIPSEPETPVIVVDRPVSVETVDAGEVEAWLRSLGHTLDAVWVQRDGTLIVVNPGDGQAIADALAGYTGYTPPDSDKARRVALDAVLVKIAAIPERDRTLAEQAILLLARDVN